MKKKLALLLSSILLLTGCGNLDVPTQGSGVAPQTNAGTGDDYGSGTVANETICHTWDTSPEYYNWDFLLEGQPMLYGDISLTDEQRISMRNLESLYSKSYTEFTDQDWKTFEESLESVSPSTASMLPVSAYTGDYPMSAEVQRSILDATSAYTGEFVITEFSDPLRESDHKRTYVFNTDCGLLGIFDYEREDAEWEFTGTPDIDTSYIDMSNPWTVLDSFFQHEGFNLDFSQYYGNNEYLGSYFSVNLGTAYHDVLVDTWYPVYGHTTVTLSESYPLYIELNLYVKDMDTGYWHTDTKLYMINFSDILTSCGCGCSEEVTDDCVCED